MTVGKLIAFFFFSSHFARGAWTHGWGTVGGQLWADFATRPGPLTPAQLAFAAKTYAIVSLEKCFDQADFPGNNEGAINSAATALRALNPAIRVLFYFSSIESFGDCYASGPVFESNASWYLRNDSGAPYGGPGRHMFDLSQSAVRDFVAAASTNVSAADALLDGVFADSALDVDLSGMSAARNAAYIAGHHASLNGTRGAVRSRMRPGAQLIANALGNYNKVPGDPAHGLAILPFVDGFCMEHFIAFESLDQHTGALSAAMFAESFAQLRAAAAANKTVLVKAWPGPVCAPIGPLGPSWCGAAPAPATREGRAAAASQHLLPALAAYLIVASEGTFFSYTWWYTTADGAFPCENDGSCSAPGAWYPELARPLGAPLGDAALAGTVYTRSFEHALVTFDAANASAAAIEWLPPGAAASCPVAPSHLTVDFAPAAVGGAPPSSFLPPLSDAPAPLLGWWLTPAGGGGGAILNVSQSAYRLTVASHPALLPSAPDVWDSGVVPSGASVAVRYGGPALPARARVFWRVEVWDGAGAPCGAGAETGAWEVPLLASGDWQGASWIAAGPPPPNATDCDYYKDAPAPLFRAPFSLAQPPTAVVRARLYATGLGYFSPLLDGAQVGDEVLAPAWTNFSSSVLFSTFDVTPHFAEGAPGDAHVLGLAAGNGWWHLAPLLFWGHLKFAAALPQGQPMVLALLAVDFADGSHQYVTTGAGAGTPWAVGASEVLFNSIYLGTRVERALEPVGWATPAFDASGWAPPFAASPGAPLGALRSQRAPPVRRQAPVAPALLSNASGELTLDLGRQVAGVCDFRFSPGAPRGAAIHFRYGELLFNNGSVNGWTSVAGQIKSGHGGPCAPEIAWQEDHYTLRGDAGGETFTPRWTWHAGRYIMATGDAAALAALDVGATRCFPLRSDVAVAGAWRSSSPLLNAIHAADVTTMESNMMSVQSDCPHRERLGYGGDALMSAESFILNFDMAAFYAKRLDDFVASQRPNGGFTETAPSVGMADAGLGGGSGPIGWETFLPVAAMWGYKYYGDDETVARVFPAAARYVEFLLQANPRAIENGLGDWMTLEGAFGHPPQRRRKPLSRNSRARPPKMQTPPFPLPGAASST